MDIIRKLIRNVFGFSRTEINGFIILLPLAIMVVSVVPLYSSWLADQKTDYSKEEMQLDSLMSLFKGDEKKLNDTSHVTPMLRNMHTFFSFNPNIAAVSELKRLGFTEILSTRIA